MTWSCALVTGGAGFIGSHLVDGLVRRGVRRVVVVDDFFLGSRQNLAEASAVGEVIVYREDASDLAAMRAICETESPDVVFDLATRALLYSFFNPATACRINLDIALTLAELQRLGAFGTLVHFSSSEVYGSGLTVPMAEDHPMLAETTYAAGKGAADLLLSSYVRMFDQDIRIFRPFNNYGPRQNDGDLAAVIPITIRRILDGESPTVFGDGLQTRDFIYVTDTVEAILKLSELDETRGALLNVGSGQETTIISIMEKLCALLGWTGGIEFGPTRTADVRRHLADVSSAESLIGTIARTPLDVGLEKTVASVVDH